MRGRPKGFEIFTPARLPFDTDLPSTSIAGDILHLHWIAKLIDFPSFFGSLPADLPVVWTLHDMNPFTGGCHFSAGCENFRATCGQCPQLAHAGPQDLSHSQLELKRAALRHTHLHIVAPSEWLLEGAQKSEIFRSARSFHCIPYGLDVEQFSPRSQVDARRRFGVDPESVIIGFGADSLTNRRKGWSELVQALSQLKCHQPTVALVFGDGKVPESTDQKLTIKQAGFVRDPSALADLYSAMDLFVLPSLEDNLPQTGLEAMACGIPVVAFDVGGIPDFVKPNLTGLLAKPGDPVDLARQIERLIGSSTLRRTMSANARQLILEQFTSRLEAARYMALYREVLGGRISKYSELQSIRGPFTSPVAGEFGRAAAG